jgi:protocatechuate 3,4-dioxygenase beta subunit
MNLQILSSALLATVFLLVFIDVLSAQSTHTKVAGTVKDANGANLPGVTVSLLHTNQAVVGSTTTDASGNFSFTDITPGRLRT